MPRPFESQQGHRHRASSYRLPTRWRRSIALALVIGIHLVGLWIFLQAKPPITALPEHEVEMVLSPFGPAPNPFPPPQMEIVAPDIVPLPDIQIAEEEQPNPIAFAAGDTQLIAPRPDLAHPNDPPAGDFLPASATCAGEVVLRILVLADGTIDDAAVAKSCGVAERDRLALAYAKANWRYLPATLAGQAIQA